MLRGTWLSLRCTIAHSWELSFFIRLARPRLMVCILICAYNALPLLLRAFAPLLADYSRTAFFRHNVYQSFSAPDPSRNNSTSHWGSYRRRRPRHVSQRATAAAALSPNSTRSCWRTWLSSNVWRERSIAPRRILSYWPRLERPRLPYSAKFCQVRGGSISNVSASDPNGDTCRS